MYIKIKGLIVDKYQDIKRDRQTGKETMTLKCLIYQKETHQVVTVSITSSTYAILEPLEEAELDCQINSFAGQNGQVITYLKELAA